MSIRCPHCQHGLSLKGAKPGRFTPRCTACHRRFVLVIPAEPGVEPLVEAGPDAGQASIPGATVSRRAEATQIAASAAPAPGAGVTMPPLAGATSAPGDTSIPPVGLQGSPGDLPHEGTSHETRHARSKTREVQDDADSEVSSAALTGTLGGYELKAKLGEGGMGTVYLARQVSLDRDVALKVLSPRLAADPGFVARFTREAYAAAQLAHHNVVQIHDIGFDRDTNFFSMELVPGKTLDRLVRDEGRLDPEVAVGYVLQAARGLRFAHEHGLVHRDVKPDNLLLGEQGIVKVADLGLVKHAGTHEPPQATATAPDAPPGSRPPASGSRIAESSRASATQFNVSMGTPAYMPPEQARDAAHVDHRADVYSLGCTLYDLLVGRPPFVGQTTMEVLRKHQNEPVVPPDRLVRHVPPELSSIVMRMTAKRPADRYQTMGEVVEALEAFLGVESGRPFSPKEEHVTALEQAVGQFNGSKWARLGSKLALGFFGVCAVGAVICALPLVGLPLLAGGFVGFALLTAVFYQVLVGVTRKTHLFAKLRQVAFGSRLVDWLKFLAAAAVAVLLLVAFDLHWVWLGFAVASALVAAAFHFTIDRLAERERAAPLEAVEGMLKTMRLRGLDETALRQFVCKYSGPRWEEMYEALFGYEAKRAARRAWGTTGERGGRHRKRHGAWRDAIVDWAERRIAARREERERRLLARVEAKAMAAKGVDAATAAKKARRAAEQMVDQATRVRTDADRRAMMTAPPALTSSGRAVTSVETKPLASFAAGFDGAPENANGKRHGRNAAEERDGERAHETYFRRRFGTPLDYILGPHPRILIGAILICGFALWVKLNGGFIVRNAEEFKEAMDLNRMAQQGVKPVGGAARQLSVDFKPIKPLRLPLVPDRVCDVLGSYNAGAAGALLLLSGLFAGKLLGLAVVAGAAFALVGHRLGLPIVEGRTWLAAGAGAGLGLLGIVMFRRTRD